MKLKYYITLTFLFSLPLVLFGQTGTIGGKVTAVGGDALPGANVKIQGLMLGAATNINGEFTITNVPIGTYNLEAGFIGYTSLTREVKVTSNQTATVNFQLEESALMLDEIVVTGTRAKARTAIESPVPIDLFRNEEIERQGNGDITETLKNMIPSYTATPLTGDGAAFVRPTSLRGLPPDEVLVLVNSKRRHRSSLISHFGAAMNVGAQAVDIGHIPSIALKGIEVLRDGASAQYGSDAIAGVMNFMLKDASEGVEIQTQGGQWYGKNYGSESDFKVAANVGLPLTKEGFINFSAEYSSNEELSRGVQHAAAKDVPNAQDPAMNWGRPESSGLRTVWNAGLKLSETSELYSFGNYADTYGNYSFFYRAPGKKGALEVMPIDPNDPSKGNFSWGDTFPAGFTPRFEGFQKDLSLFFGLRGKFNNGLHYDLSSSYGSNRMNYKLNGSLNASWGPESQFDFKPGDLKQADLNFNLDVAKSFNEKFNLAAGLEKRKETYTMFVGEKQAWMAGPWARVGQLINPETGENYGNPGLTANGFPGTSPNDAGEFVSENWAAYLDGEFDVSEKLLLQAAFRHEDFTEFGTTDNYKLATRFKVFDKLTLRGAYSTGFRAPTPGQANVTTIVTSFDGVTGQQVQEGTIRPDSDLARSLGGKALVPEEAVNISIGFASRVSQSLSLTFDFYKIEVDNRIIKSRSLPVTGDPNFSEAAFYTNSLNTKTQGADLVAVWNNGGTNFSLAYNYNATEVLSQETVNGINPVPDATIFNIENNLPKHRISAVLNQEFGKISAMVRANYYGSTIDERGLREEVGAETLVDMELSYPLSPTVRFVLGANNIFDNYPDEISTRLSQGMPYPRRTPIGYNGGMVYTRILINL